MCKQKRVVGIDYINIVFIQSLAIKLTRPGFEPNFNMIKPGFTEVNTIFLLLLKTLIGGTCTRAPSINILGKIENITIFHLQMAIFAAKQFLVSYICVLM